MQAAWCNDPRESNRPRNRSGIGLLAVLASLLLIAFLAIVIFTFKRWEGQAPAIRLDRDFRALSRNPSVSLLVEDAGTGLKQVSVKLKQKDQEVLLFEEHYSGPSLFTSWRRGSQKTVTVEVGKLISQKYKIQEGPASLTVTASDFALRNFFRGNRSSLEREFKFDLYPPRLEILSGQHYINQGGSECVVYRVSSDTEVSGVQVGSLFFPGYSTGANSSAKFSLYAFPYNLSESTPLKVMARDAAGNEAVAGFWYKLFPKKFRNRDTPIDDSFLQKVVPEIMSHTSAVKDQGDLLRTFVEINSKLRRINHEFLAQLAQKSPPKFLWKGAFLQLSNSQVESKFADHRTYLYHGKEVDQQDHIGFDLAANQHYPIEAANDGVVAYADYFGIYGNTVLIDHGCGLFSLYGHLSSIEAKVGQEVKKKQVLGRSGATGLALGDHLHFGMFLHGAPVNPTEWWDEKWIKDHVLDRLKALEEKTS